MKKFIIVLLTVNLLLFTPACSEQKDYSLKSVEVSASTANKIEIVEAAQWPTEKWSTSTPEKQGLNEQQLAKTDMRVKDNYPNVFSLLVIKDGYLVFEKYYNGAKQDSYNPVYSVTKSVLSALTGIAIREKLIENTNQKVSELIPEYFKFIDNPKKRDITVKNVLTMTGGLDSIDNNYYGFFTSRNWLEYTIQRPLTDEVGSKFVYNTGLTQFLSGIITEKSKMSTKDFADKYLFSHLNIEVKRWDKDPSDYYGGGTGLNLTARDMAKFGYLYLNNGLWEGKQIIPKEWVEASTSKQFDVGDGVDYGYLFWIKTIKNSTTGKSYYTYRADGAGGQKILVIPELQMIVVVTANENKTSRDNKDTQSLIEDFVIPAVEDH